MWICPKCKREFKRTNQGHYCGKAPENVTEYIESQLPESREYLSELRNIILSSVPEIKERIAWSMPVFEKENRSVSFAACKKHISLYLNFEIPEKFKSQLSEFEIRKNTLRLPYGKKLPAELIGDIIKQRFESE
ncbi:MAG: DUF1801 domain-containing protein [Oscillospiraceae bacterium]|nr:DUF1801 domain-containing protein [Oscillospiraceae bacterium]